MKMSEHFPEAFQVEHNKSFEVQDVTWDSYGVGYESSGEQDSAIEYAVLNHDRMADEIAELREALSALVNQVKVRAGERHILEADDIMWASKFLSKHK